MKKTYRVVAGCFHHVGYGDDPAAVVALARTYLEDKPLGTDVRVDTLGGHTIGRIYSSTHMDTGERDIFGWGIDS